VLKWGPARCGHGWKGFVNYSSEERQFSLPGTGGPAYDFADHAARPSRIWAIFSGLILPALFSDVFDRKERS
jgi:hypothetical protein